MKTRYWMLLAIVFCLVWGSSPGSRAQPHGSPAQAAVSIDELSTRPRSHLGAVQVTGVVGLVTAGQSFVLIDCQEYKECGLSCLTEAGTRKVPVRWAGVPPKVGTTVQVRGTLIEGPSGLVLTAEQMGMP